VNIMRSKPTLPEWIMFGIMCTLFLFGTGLYIHQSRADEHYEMTGTEAVKLVRALDNALVARQQADTATKTYNDAMAEVRKAHGWPDDLIFDGTEWKHAPKPPEAAKPEVKK
jgi:hypothetical protein